VDCRQPDSAGPLADEGGIFEMETHRLQRMDLHPGETPFSTRKDKVKRSGDRWTLDTTALDDPVKEAWLVVRASDFHPLQQHIRFADDRHLDFEGIGLRDSHPRKDPIANPSRQLGLRQTIRHRRQQELPKLDLSRRGT